MEQGIPKDEAILLADSCINKPLRAYLINGTKKLFDYAENPFLTLVQASKEREENYFGNSFEFERPVDNEYGYVLNIKKCLFHETLKVLDREELQHTLCRMDLGWINGIDPEKQKLYKRINRFQFTLRSVRKTNFVKLTDFAYENNYFDQSHFIRDFKEFVAMLTDMQFSELKQRLQRSDNYSKLGDWTIKVILVIKDNPHLHAIGIAQLTDFEKE